MNNNDTIDPETQRRLEAAERQHERDTKRQELAEALSSFVNGADDAEIKELACDMARDHRTLVQMKMGLFLSFCKVLDNQYKEGRFDARNEASCKIAGRILDCNFGYTKMPLV
jgi:hypothetical protein